MNKQRLLQLADFLETIDEEEFDLIHFIGDNVNTLNLKADNNNGYHMNPNCGTTACALGWATALWPEQFYFKPRERIRDNVFYLEFISKDGDCGEEFFDIEVKDWEYLFGGYEKRTPKREAEIIRDFCDGYYSDDLLAK